MLGFLPIGVVRRLSRAGRMLSMGIIFVGRKRQPMGASQTPESVAIRLRDQFAPSYLTLTSIIQGVALSALVIRVESVGELLDLSGWLLVAATVLSLLLIWHEYLMQALAYVWMPTLLDSAIPFAFLVVELFLTNFVYGNQRAWLLACAVAFTVGLAANVLARTQTDRERRQNAGVVEAQRDSCACRLALAIARCHLAGSVGVLRPAGTESGSRARVDRRRS
jgi:hypothetical protein